MLYNTRTYNLDRYNSPDSVSYAGANHSPIAKDLLTLARTYPKPVKDFLGVSKPYFKQVKTVTVNATTGEKQDLIFYIGGSVPVGTPSADIDGVLADAAAWINTADAKALFKSLDVTLNTMRDNSAILAFMLLIVAIAASYLFTIEKGFARNVKSAYEKVQDLVIEPVTGPESPVLGNGIRPEGASKSGVY